MTVGNDFLKANSAHIGNLLAKMADACSHWQRVLTTFAPVAVAQILDNLLKLMQHSEFRIMASEFSTSTEEHWALSGFQFRILDSEFSNLYRGATRRGCV
jgi:hypothetical protein